MLRRQLAQRSKNSLKDTLGAVDEIVAMTDRVLEIRLRAPRPFLLQLLAQPEFALVRNGQGSGPFAISDKPAPAGQLRPDSPRCCARRRRRTTRGSSVSGAKASVAIRDFVAGELDRSSAGHSTTSPMRAASRFLAMRFSLIRSAVSSG
jgi:peptide/nickel transport system substrate-binding protein